MAFEALSDRFTAILKKVKGQSRLTEANMDEMLKEVRIALLEADVNFKVVKEFINNIKQEAIGQDVFLKLNPGQMVVSIVHDNLSNLLGDDNEEISLNKNKPTIFMMCGLQGSGKTTTSGKLALLYKKKFNKKVLLAALDTYRPAAITQLEQIAKRIGVDIVSFHEGKTPLEIAKIAKEKAYNDHYDLLILDTAGRLQIDEILMNELKDIKNALSPEHILLLVDASSGQDAVNVAKTFNEELSLTGAIMSKLDGDARGGASLSIKHLTNVSIKFVGVGEKLEDLDVFYPDRMADRILGMGDILTLVDKVKENMDEKETAKAVNKMLDGRFTLVDMLDQMKQVQKMGSLSGLLKMIPGMPKITEEQKAMAEKEMKNFEVIINSMTPEERIHPEMLKNSRKIRIARGSGKTSADINRVLKKYEQSKEMMKKVSQMKKSGKMPPKFW